MLLVCPWCALDHCYQPVLQLQCQQLFIAHLCCVGVRAKRASCKSIMPSDLQFHPTSILQEQLMPPLRNLDMNHDAQWTKWSLPCFLVSVHPGSFLWRNGYQHGDPCLPQSSVLLAISSQMLKSVECISKSAPRGLKTCLWMMGSPWTHWVMGFDCHPWTCGAQTSSVDWSWWCSGYSPVGYCWLACILITIGELLMSGGTLRTISNLWELLWSQQKLLSKMYIVRTTLNVTCRWAFLNKLHSTSFAICHFNMFSLYA